MTILENKSNLLQIEKILDRSQASVSSYNQYENYGNANNQGCQIDLETVRSKGTLKLDESSNHNTHTTAPGQ